MPPNNLDAAIVGIYEYPLRKVDELSSLQIKAESAIFALQDAGLTWKDVDAIYEAGEGGSVLSGIVSTPEYFGFNPRIIDTTMHGGASFEVQAAHAKQAIAAGKANVALLTYGSTMRREAFKLGSGGRTLAQGPAHPDRIGYWGRPPLSSGRCCDLPYWRR